MLQSRWATAPKAEDSNVKAQGPDAEAEAEAPSGLDASAATFSPATNDVASQEPEPPIVDEFTPTGPAEDALFDDIVPTDESMRVRSDDDLFADDFTPAPEPVVQPLSPIPAPVNPPMIPTRTDDPQTRGRGRGKGRGRGGPPRGTPRSQPPTTAPPPPAQPTQTEADPSPAPENAPTGPRKESVPSVRGDRHATGGIRKPKLSEAELAEKMAAIQIKNATLTAAHARAEADAASFAHRESEAKQQAAQRQKEERRDRQQMMGEREKNRLRKLKAMEGREWDAEKNEEDFGRGGRFDKRGGFAGDKGDYTDGREYLYREGRGGKDKRGKGREEKQSQRAPGKEEFPALPGAANGGEMKDGLKASDPIRSWADQVEGTET